MFPRKPFGTL